MGDADGHTHQTRFRIPRQMWAAFGRVATRLGTDRTDRLLDHIRADITTHGDDQDRADLEAAETELEQRRARKGGRPKKRGATEK